jgi:hypothetical protein
MANFFQFRSNSASFSNPLIHGRTHINMAVYMLYSKQA